MNNNIKFSAALKILVTEVITNSKPLDKTVEYFFKNTTGITNYDKESIYQLFNFTIRYWLIIHEIYKKQFSPRNIDFHEILHIQQILERHLHGKLICKGNYERQVIELYNQLSTEKNIKESFPQWLNQKFEEELGEGWDSLAISLNQGPGYFLRVNGIKNSITELQSRLASTGKSVSSVDGYKEALKVLKHFDIFKSEEFQTGLFEMQDAGSQLIAPYLEPEAGMRVVDACAGNGGKTLHLASLMNNRGKIVALDIAPYKLEVLKKRMKRAGVSNAETRAIDSSKTIKRLGNSADRLLLDVPCSGTGVIKRNPDIKYHLTAEKLINLRKTQEEILDKYSSMLVKSGIMVYSTCSILPSENQEQVQRFLRNKQGTFELISEQTVSPLSGVDGFYMARIKRCN